MKEEQRFPWFLVVFMCVIVIGCESEPVAEIMPPESKEITFIPFAADENAHLVKLAATGTEEDKAYYWQLREEAHDATRRAEEIIGQGSHWKEADIAVRRLLKEYSTHRMRQQIEQLAAHKMLTYWLLEEEQNQEQLLEALGFYTSLLIDNRNPDASIILPALQELDGYWQATQIASKAQEAHSLATAWLKRNPCEECLGTSKNNIHLNEMLDAREQRIVLIDGAVAELARMAQQH